MFTPVFAQGDLGRKADTHASTLNFPLEGACSPSDPERGLCWDHYSLKGPQDFPTLPALYAFITPCHKGKKSQQTQSYPPLALGTESSRL